MYNYTIHLARMFFKAFYRTCSHIIMHIIVWGLNRMKCCYGLRLALKSIIITKKTSAYWPGIFSLYPEADLKRIMRFTAAFKTIGEYLESLCLRAEIKNESAFRQLYLSMLDAVDPQRPIGEYFKYYPITSDNSYLEGLVMECRSQISGLPSYDLVIDGIKKHIQLYSDSQTYKYLDAGIREDFLKTWSTYYLNNYPGISWWEFCAASGSMLGVFALAASACSKNLSLKEAGNIDRAYFPWINGLNILLKNYVSAREDMQTSGLNLTYYFRNLKDCANRILFFARQSMDACEALKHSQFHKAVVCGLVSVYLSDPEAFWAMNRLATNEIIEQCSEEVRLYQRICLGFRLLAKNRRTDPK
jgi:tetraprenyl-beta-curcumene synthase